MRESLRQRLKGETFRDVERLLRGQVRMFLNRYGELYGTEDELFSHACVAFVRHYDTYDPDKGGFTTRLQTKVWGALQDARERAAARHAREGDVTALNASPLTDEPPARRSFREFLSDLSDDARLVVRLTVEPPRGLSKLICDDDGPFGVRLLLRSYLEGFGWDRKRINKTFREIREAVR